jgi:hypothetical protein
MGERDFLQSERKAGEEFKAGERKAGEEFKAGENELNRATQLEIANIRGKESDDALYNTMLEKYVTDGLPPQAAERAATFDTQMADVLRGAVGGTKFGGVLDIDVRDPEQERIYIKTKKQI